MSECQKSTLSKVRNVNRPNPKGPIVRKFELPKSECSNTNPTRAEILFAFTFSTNIIILIT